jgi:hypothetical protein
MPHVAPVPEQQLPEALGVNRTPDNRRVEDLKAALKPGLVFGDVQGFIDFCHGTDAENVKDRERKQPERRDSAATAPWLGRLCGDGLGLIHGHCAHGEI